MLSHFAPNGSFISYEKLHTLIKHQITEYEKAQKKIEEHASYYILGSKESKNDHAMLQDKIDEWEWLLEILEENVEVLTFER